MSIPPTSILEAAGRSWTTESPITQDKMRIDLEWAWGLERGTFDQHVSSYGEVKNLNGATDPVLVDPELLAILFDDNLVLIPHPDLVEAIHEGVDTQPWSFGSKKRVMIQKVYHGRETFEYLVLPTVPSRRVVPRALVSPIPPHLTLSYTVDKIQRRVTHTYRKWQDSILKLSRGTAVPGATFQLTRDVLSSLHFIHRCWAIVIVPSRFLNPQDVAFWERDADSDDEDSDENTGSGTMAWDPPSLDEPERRVRNDELQHDPVIVWPKRAQDDDTISWDSHITGVEDPEEYAKASMARGDYSEDPTWLKGVENWADNAPVVDYERVLLNDADIAKVKDYHEELPRAASSLDLETPDYFRLWRFAEQTP